MAMKMSPSFACPRRRAPALTGRMLAPFRISLRLGQCLQCYSIKASICIMKGGAMAQAFMAPLPIPSTKATKIKAWAANCKGLAILTEMVKKTTPFWQQATLALEDSTRSLFLKRIKEPSISTMAAHRLQRMARWMLFSIPSTPAIPVALGFLS